MDELVKGERASHAQAASQSPEAQQTEALVESSQSPKKTGIRTDVKSEFNNGKTGFPGRKIAGIILFCMAFLVILFFAILGGFISGIIYASPFWLCGILCFALKRNVGLWCAWAVYALVDTCLAYLTGFSRAVALYGGGWTFGHIFAWVMILALIALIAVTVVRFGKKPFSAGKNGYICLLAPWASWIVLHVLSFLLGSTLTEWYDAEHILPCYSYRLLSMLLSWGRIISVTVGLVMLVRFVRAKRNSQEDTSFH